MEKINLTVDDRLNIHSNNKLAYSYKKGDIEISVYGDLIGIIKDRKVYNSNASFELICEKSGNVNSLNRLARLIIGQCYIFVKKKTKILIFCSCTSPGLFYAKSNNEWYFSNDESDIYSTYGTKGKINEEQILNSIASHQVLIRTPFNSLFDNILRCPCGGYVEIDESLKNEVGLFILRDEEELKREREEQADKYEIFEFVFENTLKLMAEYYSDFKQVLSYSAGIDSSVLLTAFNKLGIKVDDFYHIPYHGKDIKIAKVAKLINSFVTKKKLTIQESSVPIIDYVKTRGKNGLGTIIGPLYLYFYQQEKIKEDFIYDFTGQNMDNLYALETYAPGSTKIGIAKFFAILGTVRKRIYYTEPFLRFNKRPFWLRLWPFSLSVKKYTMKFREYLEMLSTARGEHLFDSNNIEDQQINKKLIEFKKENLFAPIAEFFKQKYGERVLTNPSDFYSVNHMIRVHRWCRTTQNVPVNYHNVAKCDNRIRLTPFSEGPLASFYQNHLLTIKDCFKIKRMNYKYFRKNSGKSYFYFIRKVSGWDNVKYFV
jgi:hypothetical protein